MLEFIKMNIYSIVVVLLIVIGLLFLFKKGKIEVVRKIVLGLVVQAEKNLGSGTGEFKYAMVVENLYKALPSILTLLITKNELDKLIEDAVTYMKEYLQAHEGEIDLLSYDNEYKYMNVFKID